MIEFIYTMLAAVGFHHPLHPIATHIPMGMVIGGYLFKLAAFKWNDLDRTAHYCYILAMIMLPITALFGFMDWQHRLLGRWETLIIIKIILTGILAVMLPLTVYFYHKGTVDKRIIMILYTLCVLLIFGLGFTGGQLVFG